MRILIVEDSADLAANIRDALVAVGHEVEHEIDGARAWERIRSAPPELIVLDLNLPGLDGIELASLVRATLTEPPLMLMVTARSTLEEKITGFGVGADDYLVKPFALEELCVRVDALGRRKGRILGSRVESAGLSIDRETWAVERDGSSVELNRIASRILRLLLEAAPAVVEKERIERAIWGDAPPSAEVLRTHVYNLRRAIRGTADPIETVRGIGYRWAAPIEGQESR